MIVIVDDESYWITSYLDELRISGFQCFCIRGVDEALAYLKENQRDVELVVVDIMMPPGEFGKHLDTNEGRRTGVFLVRALEEQLPHLKVVVLTNARLGSIRASLGESVEIFQKPMVPASAFPGEVRKLLRNAGKKD